MVISLLTLPFVMYEKRKIASAGGDIKDLLNVSLIKKNFICAINFIVEILFVIKACGYTSMTHGTSMINLRAYFIIFFKIYNKIGIHEFTKIGFILVTLAIFTIYFDNFQDDYWKGLRLSFGDSIALTGSFISAYLN